LCSSVAWSETYNVGGRNERANLHVVETICDLLDELAPSAAGSRRRLISFVTDRPGHDRRYAIDASKLERELGWNAEEDFESGIAKTVRRYIDQQPWWKAILERGYANGTFLRPAAAIDVHMLISAFCFFRMSNRYTFGAIFGVDMLDASRRAHYRVLVGDMIVAYLTTPA